jgi:RNA-dependent RNA polymerase
MELNISQIDTKASKWDVTRAIAAVLHEKPGPPFFEYGGSPGRKLNFKVALNEGPSSLRNNGTGLLTVPSEKVGHKLLGWLRKPRNRICVLGKPIKLREAKTRPSPYRIMTLEKAPYVEPNKEERLEKLEAALKEVLDSTEVQIGTLSAGRCSQPNLRKFWIEYRDSYAQGQRLARLKFEWKTKQLCLVVSIRIHTHSSRRPQSVPSIARTSRI